MGIESLGHHSPGFILKERGQDEKQQAQCREGGGNRHFVTPHPPLPLTPEAAPHSSDDIAGFGSPNNQNVNDGLDTAHTYASATDRSPLATAGSGRGEEPLATAGSGRGEEPTSRGIKRTSSEESAGSSSTLTTMMEAGGPMGALREAVSAGENHHACL